MRLPPGALHKHDGIQVFFVLKHVEKRSKTPKIRYIRYNLKIRYIQIVPNRFSFDWVCFGQFETLRATDTCVVPMVHAVQAAMPVNTWFFSP